MASVVSSSKHIKNNTNPSQILSENRRGSNIAHSKKVSIIFMSEKRKADREREKRQITKIRNERHP